MNNIAEKFIMLKTSVGGNREKTSFEWTFGVTMEEKAGITGPNPIISRILAELEFVMHLSEVNNGTYDVLLEAVLNYLLECMNQQGVLTNQVCEAAEEMLMPVAKAAKEYKVILAAHAHIDMNWMWSYNETVAVTLATFRSILNIMDQYPDFCFSQSQASVYKIVEEYDPAMMEEIKARIDEGRWEVTATAWVETDKNMPSGESLLRHIEYTREYLTKVWGVKRLEVDFSPDTFGHSANVPEINTYGDVKYYYHCRGIDTKQVLYRYQAPSGKEVLVHREHNWYNSGITPHIGTQVTEISKLSGGLKTSLIVYGVGDHGGGPTRRDVERALEMMNWKIFPEIKFGTLHEYFDEAQVVWDKIPVVTQEMNCIFQGCYTTQSRIKRGNRRLEAALMDAEHMTAIAGRFTDFPYAKKQMTSAWQNVLFTHFHDILTGSCVQDAREHAMGLYQNSMAVANTQIQNAMRSISLKIDTSSIPVDIDAYNSQSEGAGVGYGIENFIGVPSTERGSGKTRIFHVFNTMPFERKENVELTVWDWTGDFRRIQMKDYSGKLLNFQLLDTQNSKYWEHEYFRILAEVKVPAMGYTTVVLSEKEMGGYPIYLNTYKPDRVGSSQDDFILENDLVRACVDRKNGRLVSLMDKKNGIEMIAGGMGAGFTYIETETNCMTAWTIGRHLLDVPVERCIELKEQQNGELHQCVNAVYVLNDSKIEVVYSLDKGASAVKIAVKIDWQGHGVGKDMIPLLDYRVPIAYDTEEYMYDIPMGAIKREAIHNDVPALQYGMALGKTGENCAVLISDSKYGYRGADNTLALTLINSAINPDPYPERGIHNITLWLGVCSSNKKKAEEMATVLNHNLFYQPSNCHTGILPMENSLLKVEAENVVVSAVVPGEDGSVLIRVYEVAGEKSYAVIHFEEEIEDAEAVNLLGDVLPDKVKIIKNQVVLEIEPYSLAAVRVYGFNSRIEQ